MKRAQSLLTLTFLLLSFNYSYSENTTVYDRCVHYFTDGKTIECEELTNICKSGCNASNCKQKRDTKFKRNAANRNTCKEACSAGQTACWNFCGYPPQPPKKP